MTFSRCLQCVSTCFLGRQTSYLLLRVVRAVKWFEGSAFCTRASVAAAQEMTESALAEASLEDTSDRKNAQHGSEIRKSGVELRVQQ